jgi:NAD+ dependent glucose-6-phosphate dehydrogenase
MELPRLLITGINGLIGSILRKGLERTFDIHGLDCAGPFSDRIFEATIREYGQIANVFRRSGPFEYLIHLAANPRADADWDSVLNDNIVGTRNVFEAAMEFGVRRVVFASSNHVTGAYEGFEPHQRLHEEHEPRLITIGDPIRPDGYYGVSKAFGEALARYFCARWGIEFVCLRIGSVLRDDDPTLSQRFRKTWLSHRDLVQLVEKGLKSNLTFGIYYGVSDNKGAFWDISNARRELGYSPTDDASTL